MFRRFVAGLLIVALAIPLPVQAGMVATEDALASTARARIISLLDRADVQAQLQAYGVSPVDAKARVAALADEEAAGLAARIDSLAAGGSILGVALIVFLVLLFTDIMGWTKVFPFTRSAK